MTEQSSDILVKIPDDHLPKLTALYQEKAPWAPHIHAFLETQIRWKKTDKYRDYVNIFSPNNCWESDGTIIAIARLLTRGTDVIVFTLDDSCTNLAKGLKETALISYNERVLIYAVHEKHTNAVKRHLEEKNISFDRHPNFMYVISPEEARKFTLECPPDVYIKKLELSAAKVVNDAWPHRFQNSEKYIESFIDINGGYGIFLKRNDEMVAWVIKSMYGHLGMLQTKEAYKRKGYASLAAKALSKEIAEEGFWPMGTVIQNNHSSIGMFEKLGFRCVCACSYFFIE